MFEGLWGHRTRTRPGRRLRVEQLEDRATPATFTVNSLGDGPDDNPGDGVARVAAGDGMPIVSLRAAIMEANALAGDDDIGFQAGLTPGIALGSALPAISQTLDINGPGAVSLTVLRDSAAVFRIFEVKAGVLCSINGLTIVNGKEDVGGGVLNRGTLFMSDVSIWGNTATSEGGGIANTDTGFLSVQDSIITVNTATVAGGGILNRGELILDDVYIHTNGAGVLGGGVYTGGSGSSLTATDADISNNEALAGGGLFSKTSVVRYYGGFISANRAYDGAGFCVDGGTAAFSEGVWIFDNIAATRGGGGMVENGTVTLDSCTLLDNEAGLEADGIGRYFGTFVVLTNTGPQGVVRCD